MNQPLVFLSPLERCPYLPDMQAQLRYELAPQLTAAGYMTRLQSGWRRFGAVVFRNECPSCRMCQSLRVCVDSFHPSASQRRVLKRNAAEVTVTVREPRSTPEKAALFRRFHRHGEDVKGWPGDPDHDLRLFTSNPFPTEEWTYHLGDRLIGVGYVDVLPAGLSAIYFFHEPAESKRSLGTFNILHAIDVTRQRGLSHLYLGYYVRGCRSLEYKNRFRPNERLNGSGEWV